MATNDSSCDTTINSGTSNSANNNNNNNNNNNKQSIKLSSNIVPASNTNSSQIKLYSNNAYTPLKSDASDASDAFSTSYKALDIGRRAMTKAEQVGSPDIPCLYCDFKDPLEIDLSFHYLEKHRSNLIRLPIGKSSMDHRADYAVEQSKKRLLESFVDEDENDYADDDDNEFGIEEEE